MKRYERVTAHDDLPNHIFSNKVRNLVHQPLVLGSSAAAQVDHKSAQRGHRQVQRNNRTQARQDCVRNEIRSLTSVWIVTIDIAHFPEDFIEYVL